MDRSDERVRVNGVELWTARQGAGPPAVLLHGGPGMWDDFSELADLIDGLVQAHRYDQRGGGRSQHQGPFDVDTFVADLDALRAHWRLERWTVIGHSWGAALALAYAVAHPARVEALVCIGGTGVIDDWHDEYHANAAARRPDEQQARYQELRALLKGDGPWTPELDREYCALAWVPDYADRRRALELAERAYRAPGPNYDINAALNEHWRLITADGSFARRVAQLDVPTLVLHGSEDPRPVRLAERLAGGMRRATLTMIRDAGHLPWVEQPAAVREALSAFLAEARATSPAS